MEWVTSTEMTTPEVTNAPIKSRRGSSLTLVILAVNIIPLLIMGFGIFYLDKYKQNLIESAFTHLEGETRLISILVEEDLDNFQKFSTGWPKGKSLFLVDDKGIIINSLGNFWEQAQEEPDKVLNFTEAFATMFVYLNPLRTSLPDFPTLIDARSMIDLPEIESALNGVPNLSAWSFDDSFIITSTMPVRTNNGETYAVIIMASGDHITLAINEVRKDIIQAFIFVIILTFLLSVYLSSFIAIPLKKLGRAAEDIRRGKRNLTDLPDMSKRKDEIGELSIILRQMTTDLENRIDAIQNFAADVSHEIKNPITSIRSAIETALVVEDKGQREGLLKIMEQDVLRLDRLINDISRHSRLDTELARDNYQVVDLKDLLVAVRDLWRAPIERHDANAPDLQGYTLIETSFPEEDCHVLAKGESLGQVFQNLVANALSFHTKKEPIYIKMFRRGDNVVVSVEDGGPGIPEGLQKKIFHRFYSDRPDDHDVRQNSGLGLSIAKQVIDSHNGEIKAENILDEKGNVIGARFIVVLAVYED